MILPEVSYKPADWLPTAQNYQEACWDDSHPKFVLVPEWDALVEPVGAIPDFDVRRAGAIDVASIDGQLLVIDGRKRVLAARRAGLAIGYRVLPIHTKSRARREFLNRHQMLP